MDKFYEIRPLTPQGVNSKDFIDSDSKSFAPPKKRMLPIYENWGTSDAIVQLIKKIVKIEK